MRAEGVPSKSGPWKVFLSHTGELDRFPAGNSYVQTAIDAVLAAGHHPVDMRHFPNRDLTPSEIDRDRLESCDVYLGIFGFRWGSASVCNPELSYTAEEYDLADELGIPRRVFMLDRKSSKLGVDLDDLGLFDENLPKQLAFRERVERRLVAMIGSPENLATAIAQALADLEREQRSDGGAPTVLGRRRSNIPVTAGEFVRREAKIAEVVASLLAGNAVRVASVKGAGGVGKTVPGKFCWIIVSPTPRPTCSPRPMSSSARWERGRCLSTWRHGC